jgi:prefoldin subunit 5
MNLDQRIEALTQSVELLSSIHKDNEKRMEKLVAVSERLNITVERLLKSHAEIEEIVVHIATGAARLLEVAEAHENRITTLERKQ